MSVPESKSVLVTPPSKQAKSTQVSKNYMSVVTGDLNPVNDTKMTNSDNNPNTVKKIRKKCLYQQKNNNPYWRRPKKYWLVLQRMYPKNWKAQKPFKLLSSLNTDVSIFDNVWKLKYDKFKQKPNPTIVGICNFVKAITNASPSWKRQWLSSRKAVDALDFFIRLCKKSPEILRILYSSRGKLTSNSVTTIWAGAHQAFGTHFRLTVLPHLPNKDNIWDRKNRPIWKRKSLKFAEESVATSTNVGLFLTGGETRPDKKYKTEKIHNCHNTTFVTFLFPGCNRNVDKI